MASCWKRVGFYRAMVLIFCDRLTPLIGSRSYYHLLCEMQKREEPEGTAGVEESASPIATCVWQWKIQTEIPLDLQFQVTNDTKGQYAGRQMQGPCAVSYCQLKNRI